MPVLSSQNESRFDFGDDPLGEFMKDFDPNAPDWGELLQCGAEGETE